MATQQPTKYEWVSPEHLPPVGCPLVILVDGSVLRAERVSHLQSRSGQMDYRLTAGCVINGRYPWSYP
jgi:hypothetical protein